MLRRRTAARSAQVNSAATFVRDLEHERQPMVAHAGGATGRSGRPTGVDRDDQCGEVYGAINAYTAAATVDAEIAAIQSFARNDFDMVITSPPSAVLSWRSVGGVVGRQERIEAGGDGRGGDGGPPELGAQGL